MSLHYAVGSLTNAYPEQIPTGVTPEVLAPPRCGRLHYVRGVLVDESLIWEEAINASFPETLLQADIRFVGESYPEQKGAPPKRRDLILANFGDIPQDAPALSWAKATRLHNASAREILALGRHAPNLCRDLNQPVCRVSTLVRCTVDDVFSVPVVWWHELGPHQVALGYVENGYRACNWVAFSQDA